jgi:YHS domain-containing protein
MTDPRTLVETWLNAFYSGDAAARQLLADDFHFSGPAWHFHGADPFLKGAGHAATGTRAVEIEKVFAAGGDVAVFYIFHLDHRVGQIRVAERFRVDDGKIASSTLIMDTGPFLNRRQTAAADIAIDPVCHMEVDKSAPAATREYEGVTYYFCSTGCAESFARNPGDYLAA